MGGAAARAPAGPTAPTGQRWSRPRGAVPGQVDDEDGERQAYRDHQPAEPGPAGAGVRRASRWPSIASTPVGAVAGASRGQWPTARQSCRIGDPSGAGRRGVVGRIRLPGPSGVPGLGLRRPHGHLPVAYRPRCRMQRITASGTSPSTGSPCSRRPAQLGAGHVERGRPGPSTARQPGGWVDRGAPGRPTTARVTRSPQVGSSFQVVRPATTSDPTTRISSRRGSSRWSCADGVDGVGRAAPVDLHPAGLESGPVRPPPPRPWRSGPRPGSPDGPLLLPGLVGHHQQHAVEPERDPDRPRPAPDGRCGSGRRCPRRCRCAAGAGTTSGPGESGHHRCERLHLRLVHHDVGEAELAPAAGGGVSMISSVVPIRAIGDPSTCSGVTDRAPASRAMASSRSGTIWTTKVRTLQLELVEPCAGRLPDPLDPLVVVLGRGGLEDLGTDVAGGQARVDPDDVGLAGGDAEHPLPAAPDDDRADGVAGPGRGPDGPGHAGSARP